MKKDTNKEYAIALYQATQGLKGSDLNGVISNLAEMLVRSGKVKQIDSIVAEFIKYSKKQEGVIELSVTSARGLSAGALEEIKKVFGKKVEAIENVDASILGGIVVRTEDKIFDASLKTQLVKLKQALS